MQPIELRIKDTWTPKLRSAATRLPQAITRSMYESLSLIGSIATGKYMVMTGAGAASSLPKVNVGVNKTRLTVRSGRLARSLMGQESGGSKEGIRMVTKSGNVWTGTIGTIVPYANIHEQGGFIAAKPVTIKTKRGVTMHTYRMALFFWRKFHETGIDWYRGMALHVQAAGGVTMPARPFLSPALRDPQTGKGIGRIFSTNVQLALK